MNPGPHDAEPTGDAVPSTGTWTTLSASRIGSVQVRDGRPLQDAALTWSEGERAALAVADGHGHRLHFRSDTGAALAAVSAVEELRRLVPDLDDAATAADQVTSAAKAIVETWAAKVRHHLEANPYSDAEEEEYDASGDPLRAYGTTLLAAAVSGGLMVFLQIGDGDSVVVGADGTARRPVPEDPELDGVRTSSLCQPDPLRSLRVGVVDVAADDIVLAFLCTDGFGGSRVDAEGWWRQTGEQLVEFGRTHGLDWVREQLPTWLDEPARVGGDDTTMAIVVRADI